MRIKRAIMTTTLAIGVTTVGLGAGAASATSQCTVANYTNNGVFDQEGYLACLAAGGPGGGGGLPATGSDSLETIGLAAGVLVVGGALVASAHRRKSSAAA